MDLPNEPSALTTGHGLAVLLLSLFLGLYHSVVHLTLDRPGEHQHCLNCTKSDGNLNYTIQGEFDSQSHFELTNEGVLWNLDVEFYFRWLIPAIDHAAGDDSDGIAVGHCGVDMVFADVPVLLNRYGKHKSFNKAMCQYKLTHSVRLHDSRKSNYWLSPTMIGLLRCMYTP